MKITPPAVKFELSAYGTITDITDDIFNWKDLEVSDEREDLSGVFELITAPFSFRLGAYDLVKKLFDDYGIKAEAKILVSLRKNDWTYGTPKEFDLDFVSYEQSDNEIKINSRKLQLAEVLKAKNSQKYEIPVSELQPEVWEYDRILLENKLISQQLNSYEKSSSGNNPFTHNWYTILGSSFQKLEGVNKFIEIKNHGETYTTNSNDLLSKENAALRVLQDCNIKFKFLLNGNIKIQLSAIYMLPPISVGYSIKYYYKINNNTPELIWERNNYNGNTLDIINYDSFNRPIPVIKNVELNLNKNDVIYFYSENKYQVNYTVNGNIVDLGPLNYTITPDVTLIVEKNYKDKFDNININCISPNKLLQSLVNKITETDKYTTNIDNLDYYFEDTNIFLCAAESIRNLTSERVYTSYQDFVKFMKVFGFESYIEENNLTFKNRDLLYTDITALQLKENEISGLVRKVNDKHIYSTIKIGYKKQEYENVNGRFEFNGTHDYSTGLTQTTNTLELICPYRGDCYGIEFLAQKRGLDTTDNKGDNDLFVLSLKLKQTNPKIYEVDRDIKITSKIIPEDVIDTLFNFKLNTHLLCKRNESLIGISNSFLNFTAAELNNNVKLKPELIEIGNYHNQNTTGWNQEINLVSGKTLLFDEKMPFDGLLKDLKLRLTASGGLGNDYTLIVKICEKIDNKFITITDYVLPYKSFNSYEDLNIPFSKDNYIGVYFSQQQTEYDAGKVRLYGNLTDVPKQNYLILNSELTTNNPQYLNQISVRYDFGIKIFNSENYFINDNVKINKQLFSQELLSISSANIISLPEGESKNGLVKFEHKGEEYKGFISKISKNYAWESETEWVLFRKK